MSEAHYNNLGFRAMILMFFFWNNIREFFSVFSRRLSRFGIPEGGTVIDYGCGPGGYVKAAAGMVGAEGRVYAVDIHPLAVQMVRNKVIKHNLSNVVPVQADGYSCPLKDGIADVIYALDMFHMLRDPNTFLTECRRLIKGNGSLILEDGHQPRSETRRKIAASGTWEIESEAEDYLKCRPLKKAS